MRIFDVMRAEGDRLVTYGGEVKVERIVKGKTDHLAILGYLV